MILKMAMILCPHHRPILGIGKHKEGKYELKQRGERHCWKAWHSAVDDLGWKGCPLLL